MSQKIGKVLKHYSHRVKRWKHSKNEVKRNGGKKYQNPKYRWISRTTINRGDETFY